jgi:hypothetical protein
VGIAAYELEGAVPAVRIDDDDLERGLLER